MADSGTYPQHDTVAPAPLRVMQVGDATGNGDPHHRQPAPDERDAQPTEPIEVVVGEIEDPPASAGTGDATDGGINAGIDDESDVEIHIDPDDLDGDDGDVIVVDYEEKIVEALPELARLAAVRWTRAATWGMRTGLRTGARLARAALDPEAASDLAQGVSSGLRSYAREFLGVSDLETRVNALTPAGDRFAGPGRTRRALASEQLAPEEALRAQGAELLRQSAEVSVDDGLHPAFGRILTELAPDEGRILRVTWQEGPQPVVDVRAANLIGVGSQLVSSNLNMVAMQAGCRHADRVPSYLVNLQRLGLVCFSDEPLDDAIAYQVLEAQPHVLEAIQATARAKSVQRSLRLTPFGEEFCAACFGRAEPPQQLLAGEAANVDDQ